MGHYANINGELRKPPRNQPLRQGQADALTGPGNKRRRTSEVEKFLRQFGGPPKRELLIGLACHGVNDSLSPVNRSNSAAGEV